MSCKAIGSTLAATNTAAAAPTTGVLAPATDTVSVRAAALLDAHAQQYQALSAQAEAFHDKFVQTLNAAKNAYADIEAENATAMQSSPDKIALIMGGTGDSTPRPQVHDGDRSGLPRPALPRLHPGESADARAVLAPYRHPSPSVNPSSKASPF